MINNVIPTKELSFQIPRFNIEIKAQAFGDSSKQPILALHGWLDDSSSFELLSPYLKNNFIVALDLPGHGFSQWLPPGPHYLFFDFIPILLQVVAQLGWQQYAVLGHSMGGSLGLILSAVDAQKVTKLIMLDSIGPLSARESDTVKRLQEACDNFFNPYYLHKKYYGSIEELKSKKKLAFPDYSEEIISLFLKRGVKKNEKGYCFSFDPRLKETSPMRLSENQIKHIIEEVSAPTLFIQSTLPLNFIDEALPRLKFFKNLEHQIMEGHHHFHMQKPELVANAISAFLK